LNKQPRGVEPLVGEDAKNAKEERKKFNHRVFGAVQNVLNIHHEGEELTAFAVNLQRHKVGKK